MTEQNAIVYLGTIHGVSSSVLAACSTYAPRTIRSHAVQMCLGVDDLAFCRAVKDNYEKANVYGYDVDVKHFYAVENPEIEPYEGIIPLFVFWDVFKCSAWCQRNGIPTLNVRQMSLKELYEIASAELKGMSVTASEDNSVYHLRIIK